MFNFGKKKGKKNNNKGPTNGLPEDYDYSKAPVACHVPPEYDMISEKAEEHLEGTQNWLFNEVKAWSRDKVGDKQIFLIEGIIFCVIYKV